MKVKILNDELSENDRANWIKMIELNGWILCNGNEEADIIYSSNEQDEYADKIYIYDPIMSIDNLKHKNNSKFNNQIYIQPCELSKKMCIERGYNGNQVYVMPKLINFDEIQECERGDVFVIYYSKNNWQDIIERIKEEVDRNEIKCHFIEENEYDEELMKNSNAIAWLSKIDEIRIWKLLCMNKPILISTNVELGWNWNTKCGERSTNIIETLLQMKSRNYSPREYMKDEFSISANVRKMKLMIEETKSRMRVNKELNVSGKMFHEYIDKIIYINLDERKDRREEIEFELNRFFVPKSKVMRFSAIKDKIGGIGCTKSHIAALEMAKNKGYKNVMMLEDDFNFIDSFEEVNNRISDFMNKYADNWDVLNMSGGYFREIIKSHLHQEKIARAIHLSTTSGYIVNNKMYDRLLDNFRFGLEKFIETNNYREYALDKYWSILQKSSKWYMCNPSIGYQRASYSDIEKSIIDYSLYDPTLPNTKRKYMSCFVMGGLGNQMFQIASTCALSWKYNRIPIFEKIDRTISSSKHGTVYWSTCLEKVHTLPKEKYELINFTFMDENSLDVNRIEHSSESFKLHGYYLNPRFFEKYRDRIKKLFELSLNDRLMLDDYMNIIRTKYVNKQLVSLHIKRGNFLELSHFHVNLDINYFKESVSRFGQDNVYIIFSDDIEWCRKNLDFISTKEYVDTFVDYQQMYLMSQCDKNITSNSTFGWWGAWLNDRNNNNVIIPKNWVVDQQLNNHVLNIVVDGWTVI